MEDQTSESLKKRQREIFDDIIQVLLSAGYFRARINTLSDFDKVVGGLCWCITNSGEDVDVDILFQENSTIGQRIALSEAIVKALRKMNCPSPLQPHQIQGGVGGSDFPAIQPVILWLVKKYLQIREEREAQLRAFSTLQFSKNYQFPFETNIASNGLSSDLVKILRRNKAVRSYRRKETKHEAEETRVHSCLLEYGETFAGRGREDGGEFNEEGYQGEDDGRSGSSSSSSGAAAKSKSGAGGAGGLKTGKSSGAGGPADAGSNTIRISVASRADVSLAGLSKMSGTSSELSGFEKKLAQMAREAQKEEALFAEHASKEEAELMRQMSQLQGDGGSTISGSQVGSIVGIGSSEIGVAAAAYLAEVEEARRQIDSNLASGKLGQAAAFKRQKQSILNMKLEVEAKAAEAQIALTSITNKLHIIEEERDSALDYNSQLKGHIAKLTELENASSQQAELATLKHLVTLNESLKAQEAAFKASCKAQMQDYTARIKALDETDSENNDENKRLLDIEDMHAKVMAKYNRLRQLLAATNLEIAYSSRIIDDVPTRTELIQYERRFAELYMQVAWKLEETRKYYDLYNTLETTLGFLQKEVKLLNSISENFSEAMKSKEAKSEYLKQFELIVRGVEDSLVRQESILTQKEQKVDELKATNQNLVDEQRRYFKMVKDFQDECNKNEWLMSKLEEIGIKQG